METHSTPETVFPADRADRLQRFADWGPIQDGTGESTEVLGSFYYGKGVAERLAVVRDAIVHVRMNWSNYGMLMEGLRALLMRRLGDPLPADDTGELQRLLTSSKQWRDGSGGAISSNEDDYSAIRLYISDFGYKEVFKIVDTILRTDITNSQQLEELKAAVFLVELVNIDLFNYVFISSEANNFQGVIYHALAASDEQLQRFKELAARPISDRYWSIPLALISASRNQDVALESAKREIQRQSDKGHLFLWRVHVVELEEELLRLYRRKFPSSVVSTICAVPVQELSQFPEEDEVILRGPLFQLVRMHEEDVPGVGIIQVMDSVILTINRDHPSIMELSETEGNLARDLIACLVGIGRAKACKKLAEEFGLIDEVPLYEQLFQEESEKLKNMVVM